MKVLFKRCAAIDLKGAEVRVCSLLHEEDHRVKDLRSFPLTSDGLMAMLDRLAVWKVTHVALNTQVDSWPAVFHLLEGSFTVLLVRLAPIQSVLKRSERMEDCEWLAELLAHGLLQEARPAPQAIQDLRELLRYRRSLAEEREVEIARLRKILEAVHFPWPAEPFKEGGTPSIHAFLEALLGKTADPERLKELSGGRRRDRMPQLRELLQRSAFPPSQRFMLEQVLTHLDLLNETFDSVTQEVKNRLVPFGEKR